MAKEFDSGPALTLPSDWDTDEMLLLHVARCARCRLVLRRRLTRRHRRTGDPGE